MGGGEGGVKGRRDARGRGEGEGVSGNIGARVLRFPDGSVWVWINKSEYVNHPCVFRPKSSVLVGRTDFQCRSLSSL